MVHKKGFTLVELLIVIAIIGILASIVLLSVNGARQRSNDAKVMTELRSATSAAVLCLDDETATYSEPVAGEQICDNDANGLWPDITADGGDGWAYGDPDDAEVQGDSSTLTIEAANGDGTKTITCTQQGCEKSGF